MGSYASLNVGEYDLFWMKSYVDYSTMCLFTEGDRNEYMVVEQGKKVMEFGLLEYEEQKGKIKTVDYEYKVISYEANVNIIKTRLDIMGFTLSKLEEVFNNTLSYVLDNELDLKDEDRKYYDFLIKFNFQDYLLGFHKIYKNKIDFFADNGSSSMDYKDLVDFKENNLDVRFILDRFEYEDEIDDYRYYIRGLLEHIDDSVLFAIDVGELVSSGYYAYDERIAENSLKSEDKVILFTEGPYDTKVIQNSMQLLYPEYYPYFTFLDIDGPSLQMGADRLVSYQKSFISAGITNKTIFLFDNDTAGHKDKKSLLKLKNIPDNFVIKTYPNIDIAKSYPTICPNGLQNLDINGKGASIELYLCDNILRDENGKYIPIQWKAYNDSMKEFQGGFSQLHKGKIQKEFEKILKECQRDRVNINKYNFDSLDLLLNDIFKSYL